MSTRLERILAVRLVTQDLDGLARFYAEALGGEPGEAAPIPPAEAALLGGGWRRTLRIGRGRIDLDLFDQPGAPYPSALTADDVRFQHVALVVVDVAPVLARALACGARPISQGGAVVLPAASGGATAVKLRDPEGHPLELILLAPSGAWDGAAANGGGVRGLDHSAITVRDTAASRDFYAALGLAPGDGTLNHGPAQASLDGLEAPVVDVAPLFPAGRTPHLELLGYRGATAPAAPVGERDVAATRIVWAGAGEARQLRDPDGHRHRIVPS